MIKPFDNAKKEGSFQKFMKHFPDDADTTLMILKGHLLIEEEINVILAMFVNHQKELDSASLTFFQKVCLLKSLLPCDMHDDFNKAEILNRLRNKIAHNLDPKGLNDSITSFLKSCGKVDKEPISTDEIIALLPRVLAGLHGGFCGYRDRLSESDLRTFKQPNIKND